MSKPAPLRVSALEAAEVAIFLHAGHSVEEIARTTGWATDRVEAISKHLRKSGFSQRLKDRMAQDFAAVWFDTSFDVLMEMRRRLKDEEARKALSDNQLVRYAETMLRGFPVIIQAAGKGKVGNGRIELVMPPLPPAPEPPPPPPEEEKPESKQPRLVSVK